MSRESRALLRDVGAEAIVKKSWRCEHVWSRTGVASEQRCSSCGAACARDAGGAVVYYAADGETYSQDEASAARRRGARP